MNIKYPRLVITDGTIESLKWLALLLMTGDHINKYLFNGTLPILFEAGRLALPLFVFVLAYNLARPGALCCGVYLRTIARLAVFAALASFPFIALDGLVAGWWPLNILFTLLAITATLYLVELGTPVSYTAAALTFLVSGALIEFAWPPLVFGLAIWWYCNQPNWIPLALALLSIASLWFVNGNLWAFGAIPVVVQASRLDLRIPRLRWAFYTYYPLHLAALWLVRIPMRKAGYLFF
ncbi:MAG: TraX family protein [Methylobacter sp.]|jgi:hypothetical protein